MRHYFFRIGPQSTVAFFEWAGTEIGEFEKPAGIPFTFPAQFDHVSFTLPDEAALEGAAGPPGGTRRRGHPGRRPRLRALRLLPRQQRHRAGGVVVGARTRPRASTAPSSGTPTRCRPCASCSTRVTCRGCPPPTWPAAPWRTRYDHHEDQRHHRARRTRATSWPGASRPRRRRRQPGRLRGLRALPAHRRAARRGSWSPAGATRTASRPGSAGPAFGHGHQGAPAAAAAAGSRPRPRRRSCPVAVIAQANYGPTRSRQAGTQGGMT